MPTYTSDNKNKVSGTFTFRQGVHPPESKELTERRPIKEIRLESGKTVVIPMSQHLGAPCKPLVEARQEVKAGDVLGSSDAFVSAPVHSPVNGVVKEVSAQPHPSGRKVLSVVITTGQEQPPQQPWQELPDTFDSKNYEPEAIIKAIRDAGIVGMGGAAFPTAVKLVPNPQKPVETVILNGCECEPFLTSDYRLMVEAPEAIVAGLQLALRAAGARNGIIAIENNKPEAISSILPVIKNIDTIRLAICQTKYPQGGERQLIKALLKRNVPTSGLPLDVKVVVINVGTASAITWASLEGRPVTERIVTVTGRGIKEPGNFRVPVGMLLSDLLDICGGLTDDAEKIILGGPMMGVTADNLDIPILKGTSGITVLTTHEVSRIKETACIRCSRCVDHCPVGLVPTRIAHAVKARDLDMAQEYDMMACIECGCCTYICPAQIPLVQYIRSGKTMLRTAKGGVKRK
ncbi:MAG: electron transport complex subunit RsxC [Sedimentisphaerales bacterium]|nr:electron transport complex subunit RsxC [Sedimentisphaerales bacterium]